MFAFVFTEIIILLIIIFLLFILSWVWPPDSPWAPWWQMPDNVIEKIGKLAKISSKDIIYDLGCGTGKALIWCSKSYGAKGIGIEIDPVRYSIAKWNVQYFSQTENITLLKKNFFNVSFTPATVIFVYLVPAALKRLAPKFLKELKSGTKLVSYVYPMPKELFKGKLKLRTHDKKNKIFYYQLFLKS